MDDARARRFRLIAFDWDGTLADSTSIIADAIRAACGDVGAEVPDPVAARYVIGLGLADALRHVAPSLPAARHADLAARYRHHYLARDGEIPLFDGAVELLRELDDAGYFLAVATGKSRKGLDRALAHHGLARRFHVTRTADEGRPKPYPDMLHYLMATTGVTGTQTLMIGDTTHDLDLARNAGAHSVAVNYGAHDAASLAAGLPLASIDSIAALRAWLAANG
ncbi:MAG: HAD-IA family hydrolase [Casimicrobiaceae bacterium]